MVSLKLCWYSYSFAYINIFIYNISLCKSMSLIPFLFIPFFGICMEFFCFHFIIFLFFWIKPQVCCLAVYGYVKDWETNTKRNKNRKFHDDVININFYPHCQRALLAWKLHQLQKQSSDTGYVAATYRG